MVWDMRCNRRSGHFSQPVNIISNAHAEKLPGTPQTMKKKSRRSTSSRPVMVKIDITVVFVGLLCKVVVWTNKWFVSCLIIKCTLSIRAQRILTYTHNSATKFEDLIFFKFKYEAIL